MRANFRPGNQLTLLNSGHEYFPALISAIDAAQAEIFLETYIFADDDTGRLVAAALSRAARRGVTVRVLVDGFGGGDFTETLMVPLLAEGVQVLIYRPEIARFSLLRRRLRRLHRKLVVIDRSTGFVGGINIIDDRNTPHQIPPRFDYAIHVSGPLIDDLHHAMRHLWEIVVWANLKRRFRLFSKSERQSPTSLTDKPAGTQTAAFVLRNNIRHRRDIEDAYVEAMLSARQEILIASAYFLPGRRFRRVLLAAARRGVKVTILLQGRVEYRLLHYATQAIYSQLLANGVCLFEYHRSFLHAKVAVIDNQWATVGSSNIDPFSLLLAKEANIVVRDETFARELHSSLQTAIADGAHALDRNAWRKRWWGARLLSWASFQLARFLIGAAGYGRH